MDPRLHRAAGWAALAVTGMLGGLSATEAWAARVAAISPQGEVAHVRQVVVKFSDAVVPLGDLRRAAPYVVSCSGPAPAGEGRWTSERSWAWDFRAALPPGVRCEIKPVPGWAPHQGTLDAPPQVQFATGGPAIARVDPYDGATIEEDQHFLLRLTGPATPASVQSQAWCEVDGIGERIALRIVEGEPRQQVLKARRVSQADAARTLLLTCSRPLPAGTKARLIWGAGIAAAADPSVVTREPHRLRYEVRRKFTAEFNCEREKAQAPCMPLRPLTLSFSAPVPKAALQAIRLVDSAGKEIAPKAMEDDGERTSVEFASPLPENTALRVVLPKELKDNAGRPLANAGSFPLAVATGPMPPIAKFAAAPFGIVEWGPEAMVPLTLRHVQVDLKPGATPPAQGAVRVRRIEPREWLAWMGRLDKLQSDEMKTREVPLLTKDAQARRLELPQLAGNEARPFEVIGVPITEPGYHVLEIESKLLGERLLDKNKPMYVRTGVLVTNLGVHFKRSAENALAWVTTLDRAQPVAGADVTVHDCRGERLWQGRTDAQGLARIPTALPDPDEGRKCLWQHGYFVTAQHTGKGADGKPQADAAFVFSSWQKGIEPWRFNVATAYAGERQQARVRAHTVFDRTLLRAGETVSMKHIVRTEVSGGLRAAEAAGLPTGMRIVHIGSGDKVEQPLRFDAQGRAALASWSIPATAKLGAYEVQLYGGKAGELTSGYFRVEEFRLPLVDARLAAPKGPQVAPDKLPMALQLNYLAGGGVARAPVRASAVLRERQPEFAGYEGFSFRPPRQPGQRDDTGDDESPGGDGGRLVVDKLAAATDAAGAATIALAGWPKVTRPADLQVEVTFNDPNGEVQTVSSVVPLWPAARVVGIRTGTWAAASGSVKFHALLLDLEGKPVANGKVSVQARSTQWQSTRKRLVGGFYAYDQQTSRKELGTVCEGSTDSRGLLLCESTLAAPGEVELIARAADEAGRISEAAGTVFVSRQGETWFEQDNDDRIDLIAEKSSLSPGETAKLQVRMPYRQATVLVTIEREGVIDSRVVTVQGVDPVIEVPIPKSSPKTQGQDAKAASWAPNVYVTALALRGRVRHVPWYSFFTWGWRGPMEWWNAWRHEGTDFRAPTAMVDLAKPSHKLGMAQLRVGLEDHRLDVKVATDQATYAVRQTVKARVQVSRGGQPAAGAEIAFAAVDEALLALLPNRSWALLEAMFQQRAWGVETATAYSEIIGRRHYGRKAIPAGGGGGRNPTRELFDTLLLWRGAVTLDAKGEATLDVPLNDSLTSFRLVAIASEGIDRFGTGHTVVRVTQDLQMLPGLPPVAREGDRFDAIYTLRNTTAKEMAVQAALAVTVNRDDAGGIGRAPLATTPLSVTVPAGGAVEVKWPIEVPAGAFSVSYEASAQHTGSAAKDRVKTLQLIRPAVPLRVWQATLRQLDAPLAMAVEPPADALPAQGAKQGGIQVGVQPTLAGALPGIRRYFEQYPFSCLEQKTSKALALKDDKAWADIGNALPGYLDEDGLALYYPPREGDSRRGSDRLTSYVLAASHEAGRALPEASRERMLQALAAFVEGRVMRAGWSPASAKGLDLDVRKLSAIEALSRHGRASPRHLQSITLEPNRWPTAAVIDWLRILQRLDIGPERGARLQEAMTLLRSRLTWGGTTLKFSTEETDFWWWLMDSADANAARLILAVVDDPAWKDEVPRMVLGALGRQQRAAWLTTTANLWGVLALDRFAARFENQPVTGRTVATLGPATAAHEWAGAGRPGGRLMLPWPAQPAPLSVAQQGSGKPWVALQALAAVPLKEPLAAGYRITRTVSAVEQKNGGQWTRGDILRVRIEIEAQSDMTWVALNDPVPAGATLLGGGLGRDSAQATQGEKREGGAWLAYEERAQDAYRASWEFMPRGKHSIEYTVRLNSAGRFHLPPSRVEAMYAPESFSEQPNAVLEVRP